MSRRKPAKTKPSRRRRRPPSRQAQGSPSFGAWPVVVFAFAAAMRLLFWGATSDRGWPYSHAYKGDAPVWLEYARALLTGQQFELGLPLRPPGNGYLVSWLWSGGGDYTALRILWCLLGALAVTLIFFAVRRQFGQLTALVTAALCAVAHSLLALASSPNNETPYLVVVALQLWLWPSLDNGRGASASNRSLLAWGLLNGLACLLRVEHLLFFALTTGWLMWLWLRGQRLALAKASVKPLALVMVSFIVVLLPWHLKAWREIDRFNDQGPPLEPAAADIMNRMESTLAIVDWTPEAAAQRDAWPGYARRTLTNFLAATVMIRDRAQVTIDDVDLIDSAFGAVPEDLPEYPFVALYGPLNFALANHSSAEGGFDRQLLDMAPPLGGGIYPSALVAGLPPPDLTLTYPPHAELVTDGYRIGSAWITDHPGYFVRLVGLKLARTWSGVASGVGGFNLPLASGGIRHRVDLLVAEGLLSTIWRGLALLAVIGAGVAIWRSTRGAMRRRLALVPWLALAVTKIVATVLFFGYARHGATMLPVLALVLALAVDAWASDATRRRRVLTVLIALCSIVLLLEATRTVISPEITIDGRSIDHGDPWPVDEHEPRRLDVS